MPESFIAAARDAGPESFLPILQDGMQHWSDEFSKIIRAADPEDYAMIVVSMEQCAAVLRATLDPREAPRMAMLKALFTPMAVTRRVKRGGEEHA